MHVKPVRFRQLRVQNVQALDWRAVVTYVERWRGNEIAKFVTTVEWKMWPREQNAKWWDLSFKIEFLSEILCCLVKEPYCESTLAKSTQTIEGTRFVQKLSYIFHSLLYQIECFFDVCDIEFISRLIKHIYFQFKPLAIRCWEVSIFKRFESRTTSLVRCIQKHQFYDVSKSLRE